jgi:hypothetical protein
MLKRICLAFVLALAMGVYARADETCSKTTASNRKQGELPSCLAFDGAEADGDSAIIDTYGYRQLSMVAWSDSTSEVTVNVYCRYKSEIADTVSAWKVCAHPIVNPASDTDEEDIITLGRAYQYKLTLSGYVSGTVYAIFDRSN